MMMFGTFVFAGNSLLPPLRVYSIGLVLEAPPTLQEAQARAQQLAEAVSSGGPVAVRACARSLRMKLDVGLEE